MTWNEADHRRDEHGRFTDSAIGRWASEMDDWARRSHNPDAAWAARRSNTFHPVGHGAAAAEHARLWNIPSPPEQGGEGRARTDAEHAEAVRLDKAFEAYREQLGLRPNPNDRGLEHSFVDGETKRRYNEYGEQLNSKYMTGWSASMQRFDHIVSRRRGERRGREFDAARQVTQRHVQGGTAFTREGEFGYGARADVHSDEEVGSVNAFVASMKRAKARTRAEQPKVKRRRTPRGTAVEDWMRP